MPTLTRGPWPSLILNAVCPFVVYQVLARFGLAEIQALAGAAVFPAIGTLRGWIRVRRGDLLGLVSLVLIGLGILTAVAIDQPKLLLLQGSVGNLVLAILCFGSLRVGRPLMFYFGRQLLTGGDPAGTAAFEAQWQQPSCRAVHWQITAIWGGWFLVLAVLRAALTLSLPTDVILGVWAVVGTGGTLGLAFWSFGRAQRAYAWRS